MIAVSTATTRTLAELVNEAPSRAAVLERLHLDYCCHGDRSLEAACAEAGLDVSTVVAQLTATAAVSVDHPTDPVALADHIEATHHRYLHEELPLLDELAAKVLGVHGDRHAELATVRSLVAELHEDLEPHMMKEERVLFPSIRALVAGARDFPFGTVRNPIRMMTMEHDRAGELLAALREATGGYAVPEGACGSFHSLYERLERLEADTHLHIHLENNVLFPTAIAVEEG